MNNINNNLAWYSLGLAKVSGISGLVLGYTAHRTFGGILLTLAFVLIGITISLCLRANKKLEIQEDSDKLILKRMMENGTLRQALKDLKY
jgi:hypothetical protein